MKLDKQLAKGSHELILLKLLSRQDMYGYQLIQQMALLSEDVFCMSQGSLYPFLHSLEENTVKGWAFSSVFGGTTANSEYEFLTGNTTAFLPAGTVPYQMYVSSGDPTLVGQMAALGYRTVAAHPYRSSGWSRPSVYPGFRL